jgi:TatA/E family protein of Tat protein translocase
MVFLFLESIGTPEVIFIAIIALVVFGPRKLPELGRKLGRGVAEFRRASEDFKRTWEMEVESERIKREAQDSRALTALSEEDLTVEASRPSLKPESAVPMQESAPAANSYQEDAETLTVARTSIRQRAE